MSITPVQKPWFLALSRSWWNLVWDSMFDNLILRGSFSSGEYVCPSIWPRRKIHSTQTHSKEAALPDWACSVRSVTRLKSRTECPFFSLTWNFFSSGYVKRFFTRTARQAPMTWESENDNMMKRTYTTRIHGVYGKVARVHLLKCACIYTLSADSRVSACPRLLRKSDDACYVKDVWYRESSRDRSGIRLGVCF